MRVSVPDMRIWSILLILFDLKWCIHLSRSLCLYSDIFYIHTYDIELDVVKQLLCLPHMKKYCLTNNLKFHAVILLSIMQKYQNHHSDI